MQVAVPLDNPDLDRGDDAPKAPRRRVTPIAVLLGAGTLLRVVVCIAEWPTWLSQRDVWPYVNAAHLGLFSDELHPFGYAAYLRVLHGVWSSPILPTLIQHVLGVVTAWMLYQLALSLGAGRGWALVPAGVVALNLDNVQLEHTLTSDTLTLFLVVAALFGLRRALTSESRLQLAAVGVITGATFFLRSTGTLLLVASIIAIPFLPPAPATLARRLGRTLPVIAGFSMVVLPGLVEQHHVTGEWSTTRVGGWALYARVAPFAQCEKFDPGDLSYLCETTPPADRPGPDFYSWGGGPARARFGDFEQGNTEVQTFALKVVRAQPLDYTKEVLHDFTRYFVPIGPLHSPAGGTDAAALSVGLDYPPDREFVTETLTSYYGSFTNDHRVSILSPLATLQSWTRVSNFWFLGATVLAGVGIVRRRSERRWALFLFLFGLGWLFSTAMAPTYGWRYAIPIIPLVFLAAVVGIRNGDGPGDPVATLTPSRSRPLARDVQDRGRVAPTHARVDLDRPPLASAERGERRGGS